MTNIEKRRVILKRFTRMRKEAPGVSFQLRMDLGICFLGKRMALNLAKVPTIMPI
jgi:hypothetical protein